ncbi:hypothetical protein [Ralstonia pseudosolanacearum]|uniref:hypothetical protein n=1 Tax=Ralstonia pseudosolanacearum TaxID=1310165 RepID=UPI00397960E7
MSLRIFPAKVENLRSQPGCLQRYLSGPLHVNVSSPRGAAGLCNNAVHIRQNPDCMKIWNLNGTDYFKAIESRFVNK